MGFFLDLLAGLVEAIVGEAIGSRKWWRNLFILIFLGSLLILLIMYAYAWIKVALS